MSYSYPSSSASSPESFRHAGPPTSSFDRRATGAPASADPFHSDDSDTSNERPGEGQTSTTEPAITPSTAQHGVDWRPTDLQTSSSSFATIHKPPSAEGGSDSSTNIGQALGKGRQAIDVDAFKRLLLTGEPGTVASAGAAVLPVSGIPSVLQGDSSSSTADSASVSRQSIFEPLTSTSTETPRTSHELDFDDASVERRNLSSSVAPQARQKPSVPKARHGKKLMETNLSAPAAITTSGMGNAFSPVIPTPISQSPTDGVSKGLNKPLPPPPFDPSFPILKADSPELDAVSLARQKRPPTPPLARRQSQMKGIKPQLARSSSSKSLAVEDAGVTSAIDSQKVPTMIRAPPPPPQRRLNRASTYGMPSSETQSPVNEPPRRPSAGILADLNIGINTGGQQAGDLPSRTPSSASRASPNPTGSASPVAPPPLPPPRRMRGFSKSSVDSQRPASADMRRPSTESAQNVSGATNATDILADLATLQKEVDALRNNKGGTGGQ